MPPLRPLLLAAAAVLAVLAAALAEIRSDAEGLFGPAAPALGRDALGSPAGRALVVALVASEGPERDALARDVAALLAADPLVARAAAGPEPPSAELADWLWHHRFRLAPPEPADLDPDRMAARLAEARDALATAAGMALGARTLDDPTGSFARLLDRLGAAAPAFPAPGGTWTAPGGEAALVLGSFADRPFDAAATLALADRVRDAATAAGARAVVSGPRVISAEVSAEASRSATIAALAAVGLLLGWLLLALRSLRLVGLALLPLALAVPAAVLTVQAAFGSVHVIALGFGGALTGLALDYPLHLLAHGGAARPAAVRLVRIGAATTAIAFLALAGAGLPALAQVGVFVAAGLTAAALAAPALVPADALPAAPPFERLLWRLPCRPAIEAALALGGLAAVLTADTGVETRRLFDLPPATEAAAAEIARLAGPGAGRHVLVVEGAAPDDVLARGRTAAALLDGTGAVPLGTLLPDTGAQDLFSLPPPDSFEATARAALARAGMSPAYAARLRETYAAALAAPAVTPEHAARFPALAPLAERLRPAGEGWREEVALPRLADPSVLGARLAGAGIPGLRLVDRVAEIGDSLETLRRAMLLWLGIGAAAALGFLAIATRAPRETLRIALTAAAALGATAGGLALAGTPPGIFGIAALALVVGIGIDYGLFLRLARTPAEQRLAARSAGLCAASTLLAFAAMAASPVRLLADIGMTVLIGVLVVLLLSLATRDGRADPDGR